MATEIKCRWCGGRGIQRGDGYRVPPYECPDCRGTGRLDLCDECGTESAPGEQNCDCDHGHKENEDA